MIPADSSPPGEYYCPACEKTFPVGDRCPTDGARLVRLSGRIDPFLGRELDGRYTILEKLGQGGMGAVYRGAQHSVGRECAIKLVSSHLVAEADVIKRFLREAKLASKLAHPNAVAVLDFGQTDDGVFYLVMELVTGRTLDEVFKADGTFRPERVVRIGSQVCDALEGAHALQIVHRDLKPSNIMLLSSGRDLVKVLDFGLAKSVAPDQAQTTMTNAGALLGTPAFMPPELALGQPCDGRADQYSLGCVLYLLGSGKLPFTADSAHELIALHGTEPAPPMPVVPAALGAVIDRMLEKDPAKRFATAAETRDALEAALDYRSGVTPVPDISMISSTAVGKGAHRSAAEMNRLVSGKTIAAVHDSALHGPKKRRWLVPALALVALAGAGVAAFVVLGDHPLDSPPAPAPVRAAEPTVAPAPPPPTPTPAPPPTGSAEPTHAVEPPPPTPPPPPVHHPKHTHPRQLPPPAPPPPAENTVPAGTGSGSAKKPALPF